MILDKENIIELAIQWRRKYCKSGPRSYDKCRRDLGYVITAYEKDLSNYSLTNIIKVGSKYWIGNKRQINPYDEELQVHNFVGDHIIENELTDSDLKSHMLLLKNIFLHIIEHGPIKTDIETLYGQRRQIRAAWDQERIPSKELITDLLKRTLNIAPSKQNLFPFKIHVIEPDNTEDHKNIAGICALFKTGSVNNWEEQLTNEVKTDYSKSPWVLVFELRKSEPNIFVTAHSEKHNDWSRFNQIREDRYREDNNVKLASTEIGMYIKLLTGLCLENDLAVSYIMSFPNWSWNGNRYLKDSNSTGYDWSKLSYITEHPIMVIQIGYKADMRDPLGTEVEDGDEFQEDKPRFDDIVIFHPEK